MLTQNRHLEIIILHFPYVQLPRVILDIELDEVI